jgi:glycogen phosphorylase
VDGTVFFGHLTPEVEGLRYNNLYHPKPLQDKCPALAVVLTEVGSGRFGDGAAFQPYVVPVLCGTLRSDGGPAR